MSASGRPGTGIKDIDRDIKWDRIVLYMKNWLSNLFSKKETKPEIVITDSCNGKPRLTEKESEILSNYKCPDCDGDLYEGPCGGMTMNVHCDNGHRFNVTNPELAGMAPFFCQRI
jgi:hypothetical protein